VAGVLDNAGVLGKLKAQLRAHVYTALEKGDVGDKSNLVNPTLKDFLSSTTGRLLVSLVREFLEFFHLDFTLAVFDPETNIDKDFRYRGRSKLIDALGLTELVDPNFPLLSEVMRLSKVSVLKSESPTPTEVTDENTSNQASLVEEPSKSEKNKLDFREFDKFRSVESSDEGSSSTPRLSVHLDPSIDPVQPDRLGDLPHRGQLSSLGDLPPLSGGRSSGTLAPLKKIPNLPNTEHNMLAPAAKIDPALGRDVPNLGFGKDHVLTEAANVEEKKNSEKYSDDFSVSEDIEEDLDSFLNSSQSTQDHLTKEETVENSDVSLRADHVESL